MNPEECAKRVLEVLGKRYPEPAQHLAAETPWEILVATVLAAQCTDARVNKVIPELFQRWPDPASLAEATQEDLESVIKSTGFFRSKAKHLRETALRIRDVYDGKVPNTMKELVTLSGVARKTANVVLWMGFGINEGLAVDTHVKRIAFRLGLTKHTDPKEVEQDLLLLFPREEWGGINQRMVWFGREVCTARNPHCQECEMKDFCPKDSYPSAKSTQ